MKTEFEPEKLKAKIKLINPEEVLNEVKGRINDNEVYEEIKKKYDFSNDSLFIESFKDNYRLSATKSSLFTELTNFEDIKNIKRTVVYDIAVETIVLTYGRPSLLIQDNMYESPESDVWKNRLSQNNDNIINSIVSVGKIELRDHSTFDWVGTGWLINNSEFIVTNRHVAEVFAKAKGTSFIFKPNLEGKTVKAYIDFKEEFRIDQEIVFKIEDFVYIAPENEPDVAVLKVRATNDDNQNLPEGLKISSQLSYNDSFVYTLGYPARDSRIRDSKLMERIFKGIYGVKRLAPGKIISTNIHPNEYLHDCSTLGGNSGSPVIDLYTGEVVGLHHAGTYLKHNWAVESSYLNSLFNNIL